MQAWYYIRDETYSAVLAELGNAQGKKTMVTFWGDGTISSSDGQNLRIGKYVVTQGRLTRNMGKSLDAGFILIYKINTVIFYTCIISRVRNLTHVLDRLLYHESDMDIREHYTDTAVFTDHFFALMHLVGFCILSPDSGL
ncbi:Tn3 family transposase [Escherichia coli]|uniref:Tn3 family transposase n=1 Tax=Escherichia coli TaxID=562 RepID=UPI0033135001